MKKNDENVEIISKCKGKREKERYYQRVPICKWIAFQFYRTNEMPKLKKKVAN